MTPSIARRRVLRHSRNGLALGSGVLLLAGLPVRRAELAGHAGHRGARKWFVHHHRRTARRRDPAAELAGDGRRRHGRQRVGHRGHATARRHVLRCGEAVAGGRRQPSAELDGDGRTDLAARLPARANSSRRSKDSGEAQAQRRLEHPAQRRPVATRPPRRCCPRWAWWSTRAISVRCRTSPTRRTPRSPAAPAASPS